MNKTEKQLLFIVSALFALVIAIVLYHYYETLPDYYATYHLEVPGGGRMRNDTWIFEESGWGGDAFHHGAVYYENELTGREEVVVPPGPDQRNFRRVVTGALRSGSFVDFLFGDTLHARVDNSWQLYELSNNQLLALYYVPVPKDASIDGWAQPLGIQQCSVARRGQFNFARHWVNAQCQFDYTNFRVAPVAARFHRTGFGASWSLDRAGTFSQSPPQRTHASWPRQVVAQLDIYHQARSIEPVPAPTWPATGPPAGARRVGRHVTELGGMPTDGAPTETPVGGQHGALKLMPVALDTHGNPVLLWRFFRHGSGSFHLANRKRTLQSQRWGEPALIETFNDLITMQESIPAAAYLTLTR